MVRPVRIVIIALCVASCSDASTKSNKTTPPPSTATGNACGCADGERCCNADRHVTGKSNLWEANPLLEAIVAAAVWAVVNVVSNVVYFDMRRKGIRGFSRLVAFWMGTPWTWVTLLVVVEGSQTPMEPPPDDVESLFREVRRDRALRAGREHSAADREQETGEDATE